MANNKITTVKYSNIHYYAQCGQCKWDSSVGSSKTTQQVRNEVVSHCRKTGHRVTIENGHATDYFVAHWGKDV